MDFKQFRYFIAVADELHMGRAAEKLGVAQPALSQQVKQLEHRLRTPLFYREKRGIRLTEAGEEFLVHARSALRQAELALELGRRAGTGEVGRLKLGYLDAASYCPGWRRVLADFRATYPEVEIVLVNGRANEQIAKLEDGLIDFSTVRAPLPAMPPKLKPLAFIASRCGSRCREAIVLPSRRSSKRRVSPSRRSSRRTRIPTPGSRP